MDWYYDMDWKSTEDEELPRWIRPKDGKKPSTRRVTLQRVKFRGFQLYSTLEYYRQCLKAEGLPMEEIEDPSLLLHIISSDDVHMHRYSVTKRITQLLELACRRPKASLEGQEASSIAAREAREALYDKLSPKSIYSDLSLYPDMETFRILELLPGDGDEIQCTLELADTRSPPYDALSYVWGPRSPTKTIWVNGVQVEIGMNLFSALEALPRRGDGRNHRIWVDALCIDQQSDQEKSYQVAMMAKIYRNAQFVFIYLGEENENTSPLFDFLNRDHDVDVGVKDNFQNLTDIAGRCGIPVLDIVKGYVDFAFRPWFTRIWVAQEYGLANWAPIFYCGFHFTNTRYLYRDLYMLQSSVANFINLSNGDVDFGLDRGRGYHDLMSCLDQVQHIIKPDRLAIHGACIPSIEYQMMRRSSSDPRDIVYGMREFFEAPFRDAFVPDYTVAPEQLFMRLSAWFLVMDRWPNVLECFPKRLSPDLPSWVRDFTQWQPRQSFYISRGMDNATQSTNCAIFEQVLYADCIELDEIADVYEIDEDDNHGAYAKLWCLDQRFTSTEMAFPPSILTPLDTPEKSIASWAALTPDKAHTMDNLWPTAQLLYTVPEAIIKAHADEVMTLMQESTAPPVWTLVQLPAAEILDVLHVWAAKTRVLSNRFGSLTGLLAFFVHAGASCENLAAAAVFDYANLVSQLHKVRERLVEDAGPEVSLARLELCGTNANNSAGSMETSDEWHFTYKNLIALLEEEGDPLIVDIVLEIIDALRSQTLGGLDAWEMPTKSAAERQKEWSRMARVVIRIAKSVIPSQVRPELLWHSEDNEDGRNEEEEKEESHLVDDKNSLLSKQNDAQLRGKDASGTVLGRREVAESYIPRVLTPLKHSTFFVTKGGLPGVGTPGSRDIRKGDKLLWLGSMRFPIVVRESGSLAGHYEIGGTVIVRGVTKEGLDGLGDARPESRVFKFV